ncbi:nucleoporin interacting component (Nup93/Nic96-like) family protein [Actinidia rufa]|uniref:Nucleoporin interacting component (Nup93/Nic96-like) family protein n=1 Tax=Actinidia rufa TaxID=165716 RepID=A0A7J0DLZ1_9ERIC|nr:nucleoporin interacting component (Nup93/Nic96-like) family protein [Actinidia rufa]
MAARKKDSLQLKSVPKLKRIDWIGVNNFLCVLSCLADLVNNFNIGIIWRQIQYLKANAVHISIVLADHGILSVNAGAGQKLGVMGAFAEASSIIRQHGSVYLRHDNMSITLEYYAQAAAAVGGGQLSWSGRGNVDQQRQRSLMVKQLLTELLLRDGGIYLLLGPRKFWRRR